MNKNIHFQFLACLYKSTGRESYSSHHSVCVAQNVKSFWLKFLKDCISWTHGWIRLILGLMLDTGLKFYAVPSRPTSVTFADFEILSSSFWLKFLKDCISWTRGWIRLIHGLMLDTGLKFYAVPSRPTSVTFTDFEILSYHLKVFRSLLSR